MISAHSHFTVCTYLSCPLERHADVKCLLDSIYLKGGCTKYLPPSNVKTRATSDRKRGGGGGYYITAQIAPTSAGRPCIRSAFTSICCNFHVCVPPNAISWMTLKNEGRVMQPDYLSFRHSRNCRLLSWYHEVGRSSNFKC